MRDGRFSTTAVRLVSLLILSRRLERGVDVGQEGLCFVSALMTSKRSIKVAIHLLLIQRIFLQSHRSRLTTLVPAGTRFLRDVVFVALAPAPSTVSMNIAGVPAGDEKARGMIGHLLSAEDVQEIALGVAARLSLEVGSCCSRLG